MNLHRIFTYYMCSTIVIAIIGIRLHFTKELAEYDQLSTKSISPIGIFATEMITFVYFVDTEVHPDITKYILIIVFYVYSIYVNTKLVMKEGRVYIAVLSFFLIKIPLFVKSYIMAENAGMLLIFKRFGQRTRFKILYIFILVGNCLHCITVFFYVNTIWYIMTDKPAIYSRIFIPFHLVTLLEVCNPYALGTLALTCKAANTFVLTILQVMLIERCITKYDG